LHLFLFQGVPLRIEIGPRDVASGSVVISRRDIPGKQGKVFGISMEPSNLEAYVKDKLDEIQSSLLERAIAFRDRFFPSMLLWLVTPIHNFSNMLLSSSKHFNFNVSHISHLFPEYKIINCSITA